MKIRFILILFLAFSLAASACAGLGGDEQQPGFDRARLLLDMPVVSSQGDRLGEVVDLIFDPATSQIEYVLVGEGGALDLVGSLLPVPFRAFRLDRFERTEEAAFVLPVDQQGLAGAPSLLLATWPLDFAAADWDQVYSDYWRPLLDPAPEGGPGFAEGQAPEGLPGSEVDDNTGGDSAVTFGASVDNLLGGGVIDRSGAHFANVADMVVGPRSGLIEYVILRLDEDQLAVGDERYVPTPPGVLALIEGGDGLLLTGQRALLAGAPSFESLEVLRAAPAWEQGADEYWETQ